MMKPDTELALGECVRDAKGALRICGGGTRSIGHADGEVLTTTGLSGISLYEPGALTIVAQAGTPLEQVEAVLSQENQRLPFEPMQANRLLGTKGESTIGGVVAGNVSGPRRIQAGACRDSLIGVRFVDGRGDIVKNGGRVMKNVTGYDLVKVMCGAYGTLGVLTEVAFKVLPGVEACATVIVQGGNEIDVMSAALGSPYEVSGAASVPKQNGKEDSVTFLRVEGFEASVAYRVAQLRDMLGAFGAVSVETDAGANGRIWADIRDVVDFADEPFVARMSIKPSDFHEMNFALQNAMPAHVRLDWGGGLVWIGANADQLDYAAKYAGNGMSGSDALMQFLHSWCLQNGGHATLFKSADPSAPVFQPENAVVAEVSRKIRAQFDPRGILNAGLMG